MPISRWAIAAVILFLVIIASGLLVTYIQKTRYEANFAASQNNLRQLALFAAHHTQPTSTPAGIKFPNEIPPATIVLPGVPPEDRLGWIVPVLPGIDQRHNPIKQLLSELDVAKPWTDPRNQEAGKTRLNVVLCPENTPEVPPDAPAITCYVGIAGVGTRAASIVLPPTGDPPPQAGAFRYDEATPFTRIQAGLSQTLLMGETAADPGPWLRGGPSTTRGLDNSPNAKPLIGLGGQFGGFFLSGANFALCDGSVRLFSTQTSPEVLLRMATIARGEREAIPE